MHKKKEECCSDSPTFVCCRTVELTSSARLVCLCPQRVEQSMVCHHIISAFGGTHSNFVNVCYNKHCPVKFMTGDESHDKQCLQEAQLPGFPAPPGFAKKC